MVLEFNLYARQISACEVNFTALAFVLEEVVFQGGGDGKPRPPLPRAAHGGRWSFTEIKRLRFFRRRRAEAACGTFFHPALNVHCKTSKLRLSRVSEATSHTVRPSLLAAAEEQHFSHAGCTEHGKLGSERPVLKGQDTGSKKKNLKCQVNWQGATTV